MYYIIPGWLISLVTFPGVIFHELAHRLACDLFGVPVYDICYFSLGSEISGYVLHQRTNDLKKIMAIALAPLALNSLLCIILTLPHASALFLIGEPITSSPFLKLTYYLLYWIGISAGAQAFPSDEDMEGILKVTDDKKYIFFPLWLLVKFIELLNILRRVWIAFVYAYGLSYLLPFFLFR